MTKVCYTFHKESKLVGDNWLDEVVEVAYVDASVSLCAGSDV